MSQDYHAKNITCLRQSPQDLVERGYTVRTMALDDKSFVKYLCLGSHVYQDWTKLLRQRYIIPIGERKKCIYKRLRWSRDSVLAFSTQARGFKPGRSRRIFRTKKILSTPSFGGGVKPSVPCRRFSACKRSLKLRGSRNLGKITGQLSRPQFHL